MSQARVITGIRPTGNVHLGNYLGAIRNAVALQESYRCAFFIADLHAITDSQDSDRLAEHTLSTAALYLAAGVDPSRADIFVQSHVPAHGEMAHLLSCVASMANLKHMVQFKVKSEDKQDEVSVGLFTYPILMAADILLYKPALVPVGADQRQHLELARTLAMRFNRTYAKDAAAVLVVPEALMREEGARVMSLTDGRKKMSKSDPSDQSRINVLDGADAIRRKIKRAKTDLIVGLEFDVTRREVHNLLTIYQLVTGRARNEVAQECKSMGFGQFKPLLTDALIAHLEPIQKRYAEFTSDRGELLALLNRGAEKARPVAEETLRQTKAAMGFALPR
jgi:tryptophanyl-tRNA synthetase